MSKSIYNIPQVRATATTAITPLGQLTDVQTAGVQNKQGLVFNSGLGKWTNQNIVNSYNTRTGDVVPVNGDIRSLVSAYYDQVYTFSTVISPAIANTHYTMNFGGTITVAPLNPGEHIMITANTNLVTINFTGISFVTNSLLGGGTSNPSFSITSTTLELMCVLNSSQTYYNIVRVSQNRPGAICTINGNKISAVSELDDIPNVVLTSPTNGQALTYNGTNWINSTLPTSVSSVFGRTGAVIATEGDYSLTQLSDVVLSSPTNGQGVVYNGTNWINSNLTNGTVTSVAMTVPSEFSISGSPITSSGTLAVTRNSQAANLFLASPNGSSGVPSFRSIVSADLPVTTNFYYNLIYTASTTINPAIANTHYTMTFGGTLTLSPLNPGEHIMITAGTNPITVNFTGTSFVTNSLLGGGTSNPTISLTSTVLELMCVFNTGQTYYDIVRVSQNRPGAVCTINGNKLSALSELDDIPNVVLTSPSSGQLLQYNGTNWINGGPRFYNTAGLISSPKVFSESTTTNASGNFTFNLTSAGFTAIGGIQVTAALPGSNATNAPIATVQTSSTTSVTGLVVESNAIVAAGNGLTNVGAGITVYITVGGI